ncbi:hypothetical protein K443DRAFT_115615, partial [Laccaria amethystina LaAM-08-1]
DSMPDLEVVSDSDSDSESKSGILTDNDWFSDAVDEEVGDQDCSEGSEWDPNDLFEDSAPAANAPFVLVDPAMQATLCAPKFMILAAHPTFPHTKMISKILLRFPRNPSELPTNRIFKLLERVRWSSTYLMEPTSLVYHKMWWGLVGLRRNWKGT